MRLGLAVGPQPGAQGVIRTGQDGRRQQSRVDGPGLADGQRVALGGLIEDRVSDSVSKVPLLGDLPGVGTLFRSVTRGHTKTNLMVFLRPYVMKTPNDSSSVSDARYNYIIQEQLKLTPKQVWPLPNEDAVTLPQNSEPSLQFDKN